jgi:hypothetical protein
VAVGEAADLIRVKDLACEQCVGDVLQALLVFLEERRAASVLTADDEFHFRVDLSAVSSL